MASSGWREYVVSLLNSSLPHVSILLDNGTNKRVSYDTCDDKHWRYNCHSNFSWFRHNYVSVGHDNWNYVKKKKTVSNNLPKVLPRTLCIKRTFSGSSPPRVCTWVGSFDRTYVAVTIKWLLSGKKALRALYQGIGSARSSVSRQRW